MKRFRVVPWLAAAALGACGGEIERKEFTPAPTPAAPAQPAYESPLGGSAARPSGAAAGSWMWDPNRKTPLDKPAYKDTDRGSQK